jgi:hypothetical protein
VSNTVEVEGLIRRVIATFGPERALAGVQVVCDLPAGLPALRGDEQLLGIAISGLIAAVHALVERTPGARVLMRVPFAR